MKRIQVYAVAAGLVFSAVTASRGELIVRKDGSVMEGKILSRDAKGISLLPDGQKTPQPLQLAPDAVARVVVIDPHGAALAEGAGVEIPVKRADRKWDVPKEPSAPPIAAASKDPTYYVIPLHGTVGETYLADALEKSLADAVKRKPTVVVLDIDSPGGLVKEAELMMKILHRYNKELRIVALVDQDLSASAITSLSVRAIYMKSTGTIGAATAFNASNPNMPQDIQEKMQSAWRAVARNSAEEGEHEPLLAEAMIDTSKDLHLETVDGKRVVKEGAGANVVAVKGKILTLTSHEAVSCGLAAGIADDFDELGAALNLKGWKECPGLGTALAAYLPARRDAFIEKATSIESTIKENLREAQSAAPAEELITERIVTGPAFGPAIPGPRMGTPGLRGGTVGPRGGVPIGPRGGPTVRGGAGAGFGPGANQPQRVVTEQVRVVSPEQRAKWKDHSLATVIALQKMEQNVEDEISLANTFGQKGIAEELKDPLSIIEDARAKVYADRDKYVGDSSPAAPPVVVGPARGRGGVPAVSAVVEGSAGSPAPLTAKNAALGEGFAKMLAEAVNQKRYKAGEAYGGGFSREAFEDTSTDGGLLIGLRCGMGKFGKLDVIQSVQPVYLTAKGIIPGKLHGNPAAKPVVDLIARDGYAVGGAKLGGGANLDALALVFVRIGDEKLNVADSYETERLGNADKYTTVMGTTPIVGITGKTNNTGSLALGLVFVSGSEPTVTRP